MADKKISALVGATTPLAGTEVLPIVQSGATLKVSVDNLTVGKPVETGLLTVKKDQSGVTTTLTVQNGNAAASSDVAHVFSTANGNWTVKAGRSTGLMTWTSANAIEVFRIANAGDVTVGQGNLVQGTAAKGVNFTANTPAAGMTSQLLNWYEEGTWTPTDASGAGLTLSVTSANYTKIGNTVRLEAFITFPATASGASVLLGGLPFSSAAYAIGAVRSTVACVATAVGSNIYVNNPFNTAITNVQLTNSLFIFTVVYNV